MHYLCENRTFCKDTDIINVAIIVSILEVHTLRRWGKSLPTLLSPNSSKWLMWFESTQVCLEFESFRNVMEAGVII